MDLIIIFLAKNGNSKKKVLGPYRSGNPLRPFRLSDTDILLTVSQGVLLSYFTLLTKYNLC